MNPVSIPSPHKTRSGGTPRKSQHWRGGRQEDQEHKVILNSRSSWLRETLPPFLPPNDAKQIRTFAHECVFTSVVTIGCNNLRLRTLEGEAGRSGVQSQSPSKLEASLGYIRLCPKRKKKW